MELPVTLSGQRMSSFFAYVICFYKYGSKRQRYLYGSVKGQADIFCSFQRQASDLCSLPVTG